MAIEIVDFPMKNGGSFHSYVSLPEGSLSVQLDIIPINYSYIYHKPLLSHS